MELLIGLWITFSITSGIVSHSKGRSVFGYFMMSLLLSPVIGMTAAIVAVPNADILETRIYNKGKTKRCAACHELVRQVAGVCIHCGSTDFLKRL